MAEELIKSKIRYAEQKVAEILRESDYLVDFSKGQMFTLNAIRGSEVRFIKVVLSKPTTKEIEELKKIETPQNVKKEIWIKVKKGIFGKIKFDKIFLS